MMKTESLTVDLCSHPMITHAADTGVDPIPWVACQLAAKELDGQVVRVYQGRCDRCHRWCVQVQSWRPGKPATRTSPWVALCGGESDGS